MSMLKAIAAAANIVALSLLCECDGDGPICGGEPEVEVEIVDLDWGDTVVRGIARNFDSSKHHVVVWASTDAWYPQPTNLNPYTPINSNGTWECRLHSWKQIIVLIVDTTLYLPPGQFRSDHPWCAGGVVVWDGFPKLSFAGYVWHIRNIDSSGPGPNCFSADEENVWVDEMGLHLHTTPKDTGYCCADVYLEHALGYGQYTFQVASRLDLLDDSAVFSGFTYESDSEEVDIEFSCILADPHCAQYVIQPWGVSGNKEEFPYPPVKYSSHRFDWRKDGLVFTSWRGLQPLPHPDSVIHRWVYRGDWIPQPGCERMHFNLWLFRGATPQHSDEVVIRRFRYEP